MTTLCITGTPGPDFDSVSKLLFQGGLASAKPIERETTIGMEDWHARVAPVLKRQQEPGRLWEQLAGDLLLANFHQPLWGWADPGSLEALEFWSELEPGMVFLLLASDPEEYLAYNLLEGVADKGPGEDEKTCLEQWRNDHERMLTFYLDYPERCLLVNARQARANPLALAEKLNERWGVELDLSASHLPVLANNSQQNAPITLARYVAEKTLMGHGERLTPFRDELRAAELPLAEPSAEADIEGNILGSANLSLASILRDYQQRCARDLSEGEREALDALRRENGKLLTKLRHAEEQLEASTETRQRLEQQLAEIKALPSASRDMLTSLEEQRLAESEMLLLQLHQAQEELEHYFLLHQQASEEVDKLKAENRKLNRQKEIAQQAGASKGLFGRLGGRKSASSQPRLAYEAVQLRREQVNPDYEHLWITLKDVVFCEQYASTWQFRLSCAGIKADEFGKQPKLEIPEQDDQLLQNWFEESESEHGKKLELRFALPDAMDSEVWRQISSDDQKLIRSLLQQLPELLRELKQAGCHISRDWAEWQNLAENMKRIHRRTARK